MHKFLSVIPIIILIGLFSILLKISDNLVNNQNLLTENKCKDLSYENQKQIIEDQLLVIEDQTNDYQNKYNVLKKESDKSFHSNVDFFCAAASKIHFANAGLYVATFKPNSILAFQHSISSNSLLMFFIFFKLF